MLFGNNFCGQCGESLKCYNCGGTGKVKNLSTNLNLGTSCCGSIQYGNYCTQCRRSLKPLFEEPKEKNCPTCSGSGRKFHICRGL